MSNNTGLASAVDKPSSGVTTLASRFEAPQPTPSKASSRVSDLASRFSNSSAPTPAPASAATPTLPPKPKPSPSPTPPPEPPLSRKVSDLQRAFSTTTTPAASDFSARKSAFAKADSESRVSAFARKLDSTDGPTEKVAGVARAFESRDTGKPVLAPRLKAKVEEVGKVEKGGKGEKGKDGKGKDGVSERVDRFDVVASKFEHGTAGEREREEAEGNGGKARERFLDAAKRFGG